LSQSEQAKTDFEKQGEEVRKECAKKVEEETSKAREQVEMAN